MSWYINVGKSLQTHYDFVELLIDKWQKSRVQIENLESQLSKIGKSVTLLQSYYEKNVTIVQSLRRSGSNQTALDISAKHMNDEIPRHILKRKNLKRRKTPSSWIINIELLAICMYVCVCAGSKLTFYFAICKYIFCLFSMYVLYMMHMFKSITSINTMVAWILHGRCINTIAEKL